MFQVHVNVVGCISPTLQPCPVLVVPMHLFFSANAMKNVCFCFFFAGKRRMYALTGIYVDYCENCCFNSSSWSCSVLQSQADVPETVETVAACLDKVFSSRYGASLLPSYGVCGTYCLCLSGILFIIWSPQPLTLISAVMIY